MHCSSSSGVRQILHESIREPTTGSMPCYRPSVRMQSVLSHASPVAMQGQRKGLPMSWFVSDVGKQEASSHSRGRCQILFEADRREETC